MKTFNFIFVNQHTTQNFTIQKNQQKVLCALVRFVKFKSSLCWERNPFFGTSWIFGAWWIALGQALTSRKSLKRIPYAIYSSLKVGSGIPTSDLLSSCTHAESKEISKEQGRIYFSFQKLKQEAKKGPYSYKEKHF